MTAAGFKEIALTGVHLGSYGRDLEPRSSLIELLRALDRELPGSGSVRLQPDRDPHVLFRISSLEPMDCSREIVDLVASSDRFAPHFHLPLQHASNRVLAAMRRPYTIEYYAVARRRHPRADSQRLDRLGHHRRLPGRDRRGLRAARGLPRALAADAHPRLPVFRSSGDAGVDDGGQGERCGGSRARAHACATSVSDLTERFRGSQVGTTHRALTLEDGTLAVTGNYLKVRIPPGRARNEWVRVRLTSQDDGELLGG